MIDGKLLMIFCVSGALEVIIRSASSTAAPSISGIQARVQIGGNTYAAQTKPEAINPNKVVSASVGPSPPSTKNIPSRPLDPRFRLEAVNSASIFSQTSVLNLVISSGVNLVVPWPHRVAVILRYASCPTMTCTG